MSNEVVNSETERVYCPKCDYPLLEVASTSSGVKMYCAACCGVWEIKVEEAKIYLRRVKE